MTCNPRLARGHGYIIIDVDYFTKWDKAMIMFVKNGKNLVIFIFNHIVTRFGFPQAIIIDHGSHFHNFVMSELTKNMVL
jgi:hypothetical protein